MVNLQGLLDQLNKRLAEPLPMNRFRPNIVVTACRPAEEDEWQEYTIGPHVVVEAVKPCDRCLVSTPGDLWYPYMSSQGPFNISTQLNKSAKQPCGDSGSANYGY